MSVRAKALTVRLPEDLYRASAEVAKRRKVGEDANMTDVEFAVDAQREVVKRGNA